MGKRLVNVMLGDNPAMNLQPIQGFNLVEILLLALMLQKLEHQPDGPLVSHARCYIVP